MQTELDEQHLEIEATKAEDMSATSPLPSQTDDSNGNPTPVVPEILISPATDQGEEAALVDPTQAATPVCQEALHADGEEPPIQTSSPITGEMPAVLSLNANDVEEVATRILSVTIQCAMVHQRHEQQARPMPVPLSLVCIAPETLPALAHKDLTRPMSSAELSEQFVTPATSNRASSVAILDRTRSHTPPLKTSMAPALHIKVSLKHKLH